MDSVKVAGLRAAIWVMSKLASLFAAHPWIVRLGYHAIIFALACSVVAAAVALLRLAAGL
jgi:hypothetical protein